MIEKECLTLALLQPYPFAENIPRHIIWPYIFILMLNGKIRKTEFAKFKPDEFTGKVELTKTKALAIYAIDAVCLTKDDW